MALEKKSSYPTTAGILTIIGACIVLFVGTVYMADFFTYYRLYLPRYLPGYFLAGIFGFLGFAFGLMGGILALKRRMFSLVIIGMALMMAGGIFSFAEPIVGIIFGIPVLVLAILSVIFIGISHREFK